MSHSLHDTDLTCFFGWHDELCSQTVISFITFVALQLLKGCKPCVHKVCVFYIYIFFLICHPTKSLQLIQCIYSSISCGYSQSDTETKQKPPSLFFFSPL